MPPIEHIFDMLLKTILPAFAVAAVVTAAVERIGGSRQARTGAALGLVAGVALGFWIRNDILPLASGNSASWNRLPWACLIAICVGRVAQLSDTQRSDGWLLRGAASIGIAWWVIPDHIYDEHAWLVAAFAALAWANWMLLDLLAELPNNVSVGVCIVLSLLTAGGVLVFAGIARYMETAVLLASAFAGITVISAWRKFEINSAVPVVAIALPGLLLMGNRESSVESIHVAAYVLPALAPLFLAASLPCGDWPKARLHAFRIGIVLVPLIVAMVLARQGGSFDFGEPEW